jgi:molybdopterin molybdotransferase
MLLPGEPLACLVAYDMLAARLVRRLAGAATALPYKVVERELARKIVSGIGSMEIVLVRLAGNQALPIGADAGLAGAVLADGFVVVAEASEGHPAGARVRVHLYDTRPPGTAQDITS